jgi:hypothetical protein
MKEPYNGKSAIVIDLKIDDIQIKNEETFTSVSNDAHFFIQHLTCTNEL